MICFIILNEIPFDANLITVIIIFTIVTIYNLYLRPAPLQFWRSCCACSHLFVIMNFCWLIPYLFDGLTRIQWTWMFEFDLWKENLARFPIHRLEHVFCVAFSTQNVPIPVPLFAIHALFTCKFRAACALHDCLPRHALTNDASEQIQ